MAIHPDRDWCPPSDFPSIRCPICHTNLGAGMGHACARILPVPTPLAPLGIDAAAAVAAEREAIAQLVERFFCGHPEVDVVAYNMRRLAEEIRKRGNP